MSVNFSIMKFALKFKVALENIQELSSTHPKFRWFLKFSCCECRETTDEWNYLSFEDLYSDWDIEGYNFVSDCKVCQHFGTVKMIEESFDTYTADDDGSFKTIVIFDCEGLKPVDFKPKEGWVIKTVNHGTKFENVNLQEGSWSEYCEIIKQPVSVNDIEHLFEKIK